MSDSGELRDELLALKADLSRLLTTTGEELFNTSKNLAEALADQIKAVGYHFADERFVSSEYVSINEIGKMHTYRVLSVSHL